MSAGDICCNKVKIAFDIQCCCIIDEIILYMVNILESILIIKYP